VSDYIFVGCRGNPWRHKLNKKRANDYIFVVLTRIFEIPQ